MTGYDMTLVAPAPTPSDRSPGTEFQDPGHGRSYRSLRQSVGWIGLLLPLVLIVGHAVLSQDKPVLHSISRYYHTEMRNLFVGSLCAMAVFLFHYGSTVRPVRWAAGLAGIFALGVAFCPVARVGEPVGPVAAMHYGSALGLFAVLAMMSLGLFGRGPGAESPEGQRRLVVHRLCGLVIVASIAMNVLHAVAVDCDPARCEFVLWTETAALAAFGISWLTEGRSLRRSMSEPEAKAA